MPPSLRVEEMVPLRLEDIPRELLIAVAALATAWALVLSARSSARRRRMRRRFARGGEGEREAIAILEAHGFTIEGAQVVSTYDVWVDDGVVPVSVRADYVVSRGDERWVAEVKTGPVATRVETPATRRQLLEYEHAFGVDGIALVDADARTVRSIAFRPRRQRESTGRLVLLCALAAVAALVWSSR